jgi:hypothetical protein
MLFRRWCNRVGDLFRVDVQQEANPFIDVAGSGVQVRQLVTERAFVRSIERFPQSRQV